MIHKKTIQAILLPLLLSTLSLSGYSQAIRWKTGVNSFFDNREYFNDYADPQSILGVRGFGILGFEVNSENQFYGGADLLYEFGDKVRTENIKPILYFQHQNKTSQVLMGVFPRKNLIELPRVLMSDTFNYYRPNAQGIYIGFSKPWGSQNVWLDWTSRQTDTERETFLIGGTGKLHSKKLFFEYNFLLYHYAGPAIPIEGDHIRDNGGLTAALGYSLCNKILLDSLTISSGLVYSYDRLRNVYPFEGFYGSISELYASYKSFSLKSTLYFGDPQVHLMGDKLYTADFYNRIDLGLRLFEHKRIEAKVEFSTHFIPHEIDYSQSFTIYVDLEGRKELKTHNLIDF